MSTIKNLGGIKLERENTGNIRLHQQGKSVLIQRADIHDVIEFLKHGPDSPQEQWKYWCVLNDGSEHLLESIKWNETGAAGWDDLTEGQHVIGRDAGGQLRAGILEVQKECGHQRMKDGMNCRRTPFHVGQHANCGVKWSAVQGYFPHFKPPG